jgi:glutathione synthase/RimK-type ligase-like ATP-grasp enzyme
MELHRLCFLKQVLQLIGLIDGDQIVDELIQFTVHDPRQVMARIANAVIRHAILREVVGVNLLAAITHRLIRDKAVAVAYGQAHGIPFPLTYFVGHPRALVKVPHDIYPVVVKPSNGSAMQDIHKVNSAQEMEALSASLDPQSYFLAMRYVENTGYDIKLYVTGQEVHAILKSSPLHGEIQEQEIPVSRPMLRLAQRVGRVFGLDLYGVDVLETPQGLMVVDINDFPSFYGVPRKVVSVAEYILHAAYRYKLDRERRDGRIERPPAFKRPALRHQDSTLVPAELMPTSPVVKRAKRD